MESALFYKLAVALLTINDHEVGLAKDSRLHADFDITPFIKRGKNTVRITVVKWSDATFIEDQDQWWHGGITRSVMLIATDHVFIERVNTTAGLKKDNSTGTLQVDAFIAASKGYDFTGYELRATIEELPKSKNALAPQKIKPFSAPIWTEVNQELRQAGTDFFIGRYWRGDMPEKTRAALEEMEPGRPGKLSFAAEFPKINPWSAEAPHLYTLHLELVDPNGNIVQIASQRIGFRRVEIKGRDFLVNGAPVIFYGINRHDFNRFTGRALSRDDMRQDLLELKRWNFNAVRTSHYPNDPAFLALCDELGFYVVGEANIESHAFYDTVCNMPSYLSAFVDRVGRMVQRDMHHPSVVMWSLGNESGAGLNHEAAATYARKLDSSRPLHYEGAIRGNWTGGHTLTDVICPMYPSIDAIVDYAKSGRQDRPLIMCEYSHAMGNSNGTLAQYWEAIEKYPGLQGGFIWEMWDHGPVQTLPDGTQRNAYGGDYGEVKHDGNFCCDGMVFPDRTAKPAMHEFKQIAAPVIITSTKASTGTFTLFNKQFFTDTSDYELLWQITRDGNIVDSGRVKTPIVAPRKSASFKVKSAALTKVEGKGERFITFSVVKKTSTPWAQSMTEVAWSQHPLPSRALALTPAKNSTLFEGAVNDAGEIVIPGAIFAPELSLWRAPTDNDRIAHMATNWEKWGLRSIERTDCEITETASSYKIASIWQTGSGAKIKHTQVVTPIANGFSVKESFVIPKELHDLARVGINFELDGDLSQLTYFGVGAHETMPDRKIGRVGKYQSTVWNQYVPYVRPQENGGHNGVRWFELRGTNGKGLRIDLNRPLQVSVTPFRAGELADAKHDVELKPSGNTVVHIDAAHRGVGTASCGPDTTKSYIIPTGTHTFTWSVTTL